MKRRFVCITWIIIAVTANAQVQHARIDPTICDGLRTKDKNDCNESELLVIK
jgi:hypothetical protein